MLLDLFIILFSSHTLLQSVEAFEIVSGIRRYSLNCNLVEHFPKLSLETVVPITRNKLNHRMIKQSSRLVIGKKHDLSVSCRSTVCLSLLLQGIIDMQVT